MLEALAGHAGPVPAPHPTPLQGDLRDMSFPEILGVLDAEGASGRLRVQAGEAVRRLDFSAGSLAAIDDDPVDHEEIIGWVADVVLELCTLQSGVFRFDQGSVAPASQGMSAEELLAAAERRVSQWQQVTRHVPSTTSVPHLAAIAPSDRAVVIAAPDWPVLALVDGRRSVGDVVIDSGRRPFDVFETLSRLVAGGLVALANAPGGDQAAH
jgi:hypothetical protein